MQVKDKVCVITGAASGIGAALARKFDAECATGIFVADIQRDLVRKVASEVGGTAFVGNMTQETNIQSLIAIAEGTYGNIDVFCSNAGIIRLGTEQASDDEWQLCWDLHLMAHVFAARSLAPRMAARGDGYLVNTASAAGLLSHVISATYTVTKHAAVAFSEWLSIAFGDRGVKVSVLCPQAVQTPMTEGRDKGSASVDGSITAEYLADCVIANKDAEEFLILPHTEVKDYMKRKANDIDRWLRGMRKHKSIYPQGV